MNEELHPPLLGYTDRLSARPGEQVQVKVSSTLEGEFEASLVRIISADPNPAGIGVVVEKIESDFAGSYPARAQGFTPGSCMHAALAEGMTLPTEFSVSAKIWPTRVASGAQAVLSIGSSAAGTAFVLGLDEAGKPRVMARMTDGSWVEALLPGVVRERQWAWLWASFSQPSGELSVGYGGSDGHHNEYIRFDGTASLTAEKMDSILVAASDPGERRMHFNGKVEAPTIYAVPLGLNQILDGSEIDAAPLFARWDFSEEISSTRVRDTSDNEIDGTLINFPTRAMTGSMWDGSEMCWRHAPQHYGAIHFHEDDIYDFEWETDFSVAVPEGLRSGIYGIRLQQGEHNDTIPLFICPPKGKRTARLCILVSTFTYTVYGNHARGDYGDDWADKTKAWHAYPWNPAEYPQYGRSTYNFHSDHSGICHASYRRPLFNLRPGYLTFGWSTCSGLKHFQADSHLTSWLENQGYDFDVVTDKELDEEGVGLLAGYSAVTTGAHPEYHTARTLDALEGYRDQGGRFAYLGGNGFYWRVAVHPENDAIIEIRRAEGGIRAWAAEPGESYNAFDGQYGGLWRQNGRPPQRLAGVGFSAQGDFFGSYYRRTPASYDKRVSWIFDGIDDEVIGNFGFSGGGAAGFELDRYDRDLGSPADAVVVASSEKHDASFVLVPEERLTHVTNKPGVPDAELIRADMTYFDTPSGGAVFSTGSITFCGSLPFNNFDNNVSTLLANVFNRFLQE